MKKTDPNHENKPKKVKLVLSYDGSRFGGWQRQIHGKPTIQGEVEKVLQKILDDKSLRICGAGRTDAGVHAYAQVAHFWAPEKVVQIPLLRALNGLLPSDISCASACLVNEKFHAIASSQSKTYVYKIRNASQPSALQSRYTYWVRRRLCLKTLNELSQNLVGTKDFKCFQSSGSEVSTTVRTLLSADWAYAEQGSHEVHFRISGTGFLKQMVRNIVGTLLEIEARGLGLKSLERVLESLDRRQAFKTAPGKALFLEKVRYDCDEAKCLKSL